ncbi:hypothetical protein CTheo_9092 [Ceratobasidium theobromae]|uniref:Uncharacterized protein n=1 Tax=Ceratobasidium theobromae TaxID=1582974 RepID=A0A5N5Q6D8_9AGAM|nr:hypothetical protein CTheo_9092 [Ceratobasidium theobromae]
MPRKKAAVFRRTQNLRSRQGTPLEETHESDPKTASGSQATTPQPSLDSESHPGQSHDKPLSDNTGPLDVCANPIATPGSRSKLLDDPNNLIEDMGGLTLNVTADKDIVLEDPPEDTDDPVGSRNPESLADQGDGDTSPSEAGESEENSDENYKYINKQPIPRDEAKELVTALNKIIQTSFHGHGRTRTCSLGDVMLIRLRFMAGTLNLIVERGWGLIEASQVAAVVFGQGEWAARQARTWIRVFQETNVLPTNVYGTWNESVIEDEDLSSAIREWLRDRGKYLPHSPDLSMHLPLFVLLNAGCTAWDIPG